MKKILVSLVAMMLLVVPMAFGASIDCSKENATANGNTADACYGANDVGANKTAETDFVNSNSVYDDFFFVAKVDKDNPDDSESVSGWTLNVSSNTVDNGYGFAYSLISDDYAGKTITFALGVKQASDSFIAYIFNTVTLNIEGFYNSLWTNPSGTEVEDWSHVSAFVTDIREVPEPATLLLFGAGITGLALYRRKRS